VLDVFTNMPVTDEYSLEWKPIDAKGLRKFLVEEHDFGADRVDKTLEAIVPASRQRSLGDF